MELFEICYRGRSLPPWTRGVFDRLVGDLRRWDVDTIAVIDLGARPDRVDALYTTLLGRPPQAIGDVHVWSDVQQLLGHAAYHPAVLT